MKKRVKYHLFLVPLGAVAVGLFACNSGENKRSGALVDEEIERTAEYTALPQSTDELMYEGGIIQLKEEGEEGNRFVVPEVTKQVADIKYRAKRIPTELYLLNKGVTQADLPAALSEVEGEQLFYFEFEEEQKQDLIKKHLSEDLDQNIAYLSFDIFNDFSLILSSGDTLKCDYSLYERNYHVAPYERILISFSGVDPQEKVKLFYHDQLFGRGQIDFSFASATHLENNIKNPS